jgi:hypothetical protein
LFSQTTTLEMFFSRMILTTSTRHRQAAGDHRALAEILHRAKELAFFSHDWLLLEPYVNFHCLRRIIANPYPHPPVP